MDGINNGGSDTVTKATGAAIVVLLLVLGATAATGRLSSWIHGTPVDARDQTRALSAPQQLLVEAHPFSDAECLRAREQYDEFIEVRLREHDLRLALAQTRLSDEVGEFFGGRKQYTPRFAEAALTWRNRWTATWDAAEYRRELRNLFGEHVVSSEQMTEALTAHANDFLNTIALEEKSLLSDIRCKITGLPALGVAAELDEEAFARLIQEHIDRLAAKISDSHKAAACGAGLGLGMAIVAAIAGPTLPAAAAGTAESGTLTLLLQGQKLAEWITTHAIQLIESFIITEDEVQSSAMRLLDSLETVLMKGSAEAWRDYEAFEEAAKSDSDPERQARAQRLTETMKPNGYLGLLAMMDHIRERNLAIKTAVFKSFRGTP